jgi:O-methyltransferase
MAVNVDSSSGPKAKNRLSCSGDGSPWNVRSGGPARRRGTPQARRGPTTRPRQSAAASVDDVQTQMGAVPYPADRVHYVQGMVEDTIPGHAPAEIAILRLDTDWYASTKHELNGLYPRLSSGGVLILDDYGWWQGSRKAVDEYLTETGARLLLLRIDEGRIAVRP